MKSKYTKEEKMICDVMKKILIESDTIKSINFKVILYKKKHLKNIKDKIINFTKKDMHEKGFVELSYEEIRDILDYMYQSSFESRKNRNLRYDKILSKLEKKEIELSKKIKENKK